MSEKNIVTPELYDANKAAYDLAGLKVGDVLPEMTEEEKAEIANMIDHVVTQEDLDNNPDLAKGGVVLGDTIKIPKEALDDTTKEDDLNTDVEDDEDGEDEESEDKEEKKLQYRGLAVISDGTRNVNGRVFHHIRCGDGTSYDLLPADYKKEVIEVK